MKARVLIMPREGVLDPQGRAIGQALGGLGFSGVREVRAGKVVWLDLAAEDAAQARAEAEAMARQLLANPIVEDFSVELLPA